MENYSEAHLVDLAKELQSITNPHDLPKDSELADAVIENCGALSQNNLEKFNKMLLLELSKRMVSNSKRAEVYWEMVQRMRGHID